MKIMHVIDSLGRGGDETLVINVAKSLNQFEHYIITLNNLNEFKEELKGYENIKIRSLGSKRLSALPRNVIRLSNIIRKIKPDIIHSQLFWSNVIARIATPKHIPLFFTNQSLQAHSTFSKKWLVFIDE